MFNKFICATSLLLILPLAVQAQSYTRTEYVTVSQPRQQCWNEQVAVSNARGDGALVGGIAGGIIGNQVGHGNDRVVATAIGAATGAIVGDRLSDRGVHYRTVQRCRTVYEQVRVPQRVTYVEPRPVVQYYYYDHDHHRHHHRHDRHGHHN